MNSFSHNDKIITIAFNSLIEKKEQIIQRGMYNLLNAALDALHEAHKMMSPELHHEHESNTLGWCLIHNGAIVDAVSQDKGAYTPRGDVLAKLRKEALSMPKDCWGGIVMSDMTNEWYRVDWEINFLTYSAARVKSNFNSIFKAI